MKGSYGNITLYAKWNVNQYTIILHDDIILDSYIVEFDLNGAIGLFIEPQIITNSNGLVYPPLPQREGYLFAGWYTTPCATKEAFDFSQDINSDMTLYAKWIEITTSNVQVNSKVNVNIDGLNIQYYAFVPLVTGSITVFTTSHVDTYVGLFDSNFVETTLNHSGSYYTYQVTAGNLYYIGVSGTSNISHGVATLYVIGDVIPPDGGRINHQYKTVTVHFDAHYTLPVYYMEGYEFIGWYNQSGIKYTNEEGTSIHKWNQTEDVILYPRFVAVTYQIDYVLNPEFLT